jgi:hypothetical protein
MKSRNLTILLIVAAALCVATVAIYNKRTGEPTNDKWRSGPLVENLDNRIDKIARVIYTQKENVKEGKKAGKIVIERDDKNDWKLTSREGYPADPAKIQGIIFELTGAKVLERYTKRPEKYDAFGVSGEVGANGRLELQDATSNTLVSLVLGNRREGSTEDTNARGGGLYVLRGKDPYVFLSSSERLTQLTDRIADWADASICQVPSEDVATVAIDHATTEGLKADWTSGEVKLDKVPAGKQPKTYELNNVRDALARLQLEDVAKADSPKLPKLDYTTTFTATAFDGTIYTTNLAKADGKPYVKLSATYGAQILRDEDRASTETLAKAKEKADQAKKDVEGFNKRHSPWVYCLTDWSARSIDKSLYDVIEAKKDESKKELPANFDAKEKK